MNTLSPDTDSPRSAFAKKLAADPELAARCEKIFRDLQQAAHEDIQACIQSEIFTAADFAVTPQLSAA